jgi:hypothetical protein
MLRRPEWIAWMLLAGCNGSVSSTTPQLSHGSAPPSSTRPLGDGGMPDEFSWTRIAVNAAMLSQVWASGPHDIYYSPPVSHSTGDDVWTQQSFSGATYLDAAIAPGGSGSNSIYMGTYRPGHGAVGALYHSAGDGNWSAIGGIGYNVNRVWADGSDVWLAGNENGGLWRSSDQAASFHAIAESAGFSIMDVYVDGSEVAAAGFPESSGPFPGPVVNTWSGLLLYSADKGVSWSVRHDDGARYVTVAVAAGTIYLATEEKSGGSRLYRSSDAGGTLFEITPAAPHPVSVPEHGLWAGGANELWVPDSNGNGILHTRDGGATWSVGIATTDPVWSIYGAGPDDLYVTGTNFILHGHR